jgi:hypothetical protein
MTTRRKLLHSMLGATIGLPWLETFAGSSARAQATPNQRFVVMFTANGTVRDQWLPNGKETDFTLSPILSPLAPHQDDLVVISGLEQKGTGGDGHQTGISGMLTGGGLLHGNFAGVGAPPAGWAEGPSVDQRIAEELGAGMPFRSLELGVQVGSADNWGRMSYRGRNQPLAPREDPGRVFDDVFGPLTLAPADRARRQAERQSILDYLKEDVTRLSSEVALADRQRLDAHLTYLREVETRLQRQGQIAATCTVPERPEASGNTNADFPVIGALQMDLLVLALACGQTRVASLMWSRSVSQTRFTWLGIDDSHHGLSHLPDADTEAQDALTRINTWYAERCAELITKLKSYPEGDGTLFDQCLLLWCNELGTGNTHSRKNAPYVLAGSAGGALETGRFLSYEGDVPHNNLLVSLLNLMGLPDTTFGRPEWCTGPLDGLV